MEFFFVSSRNIYEFLEFFFKGIYKVRSWTLVIQVLYLGFRMLQFLKCSTTLRQQLTVKYGSLPFYHNYHWFTFVVYTTNMDSSITQDQQKNPTSWRMRLPYYNVFWYVFFKFIIGPLRWQNTEFLKDRFRVLFSYIFGKIHISRMLFILWKFHLKIECGTAVQLAYSGK